MIDIWGGTAVTIKCVYVQHTSYPRIYLLLTIFTTIFTLTLIGHFSVIEQYCQRGEQDSVKKSPCKF